ncbi:MAG: 4-hydroxy-3-methylbut-2-enyl diphosphate reductase [Candidatus Eremiobacteraeota bacterium]|nr:4-hydroxy-3-methylbut-2-enyl diphosphate reductase [Candidatus Eremiobacteraeota bacterium]MBV8367014.1 4-hydroxy-3-methylbut-2-enyl diphosphate reductase [Candidatus Eremiobacteraeota bacterium]
MEILRARTQGFCFGVELTYKKALAETAQHDDVHTLGNIVHNPIIVKELDDRGLINIDSVDDIESGTLFVRAHGLPPQTLEKAEAKGLRVVDATCPMVTRTQKLAKKLQDEGRSIIILGDPNHPEVKGIAGHVPGALIMNEWPQDESQIRKMRRIAIVSQSTLNEDKFKELVGRISAINYETRIYNTICPDTQGRQLSARELARDVDVMIVIGGTKSANTRHLAEISEAEGAKAHLVERVDDLQREWFSGQERVGIATGASTPGFLADEVEQRLLEWFPTAESVAV